MKDREIWGHFPLDIIGRGHYSTKEEYSSLAMKILWKKKDLLARKRISWGQTRWAVQGSCSSGSWTWLDWTTSPMPRILSDHWCSFSPRRSQGLGCIPWPVKRNEWRVRSRSHCKVLMCLRLWVGLGVWVGVRIPTEPATTLVSIRKTLKNYIIITHRIKQKLLD